MSLKPIKKTDKDLFSLIESKIAQKNYIFLKHSQQRMLERNILELDVLNVLSGKKGYERKRNKKRIHMSLLLFLMLKIGNIV